MLDNQIDLLNKCDFKEFKGYRSNVTLLLKKINNYLFIFIFILTFIFSSCSRCPKSCSDLNPCTRDICDKSTDYECAYEAIPNCHCGNGDCDTDLGENKCTCEKDCGKCETDVSEFIEYRCVNDACVSILKEGVEQVEQTVIREIKTS